MTPQEATSLARRLKQGVKGLPPGIKAAIRPFLIPPLRSYFRYFPLNTGKVAVWNHVAMHLWWLETVVETHTNFGSRMRVDASDSVGRYISYFGTWEPNLTEFVKNRLHAGDTFVDVGANAGYFSLLAASLLRDCGKVVAIEALPTTFARLRCNLEVNRAYNVRAVQIGAWHCTDTLEMFARLSAPTGGSTFYGEWAEHWRLSDRVRVPVAPLDEILSPEEIGSARVLKVDVEGAEWNVLRGMGKLLSSGRSDLEIVMEVTPELLARQGVSGERFLEPFARNGFHMYRLENDWSANGYISGRRVPPRRIAQLPQDFQADLVFSRTDAHEL